MLLFLIPIIGSKAATMLSDESQLGLFWLVFEWHSEGSAINRATPSSFFEKKEGVTIV